MSCLLDLPIEFTPHFKRIGGRINAPFDSPYKYQFDGRLRGALEVDGVSGTIENHITRAHFGVIGGD